MCRNEAASTLYAVFLSHRVQLGAVARKEKNEELEKKMVIDDTEIKIKSPPEREARPEYRCAKCDLSFPSELDLSEHQKVDHAKASVSA